MNIMIVGVGGQGTLLASRILGNTVINEGYDVKVSEVHGMSQRGGSVVTYVKYGEKVYSPIIDKGEADIILAFEKLEAYRAMPYLKKDGLIICNNQEINPMPVIIGATTYPENIFEKISKKVKYTGHCVVTDACKKCKQCMKLGCPAISVKNDAIVIDQSQCNGCGLCTNVCPFKAIVKED